MRDNLRYDDGPRSNVPGHFYKQTCLEMNQGSRRRKRLCFRFHFSRPLRSIGRSHVEQRDTDGSRFLPSNPALTNLLQRGH
jgi:hypothetical protein